MSLDKLHEASFIGKLESNILNIKLVSNHVPVHLKLSGILDRKNIMTLQSSIIKFLKGEENSIVLNLSNLQKIDEEALRRFFKKIEKYCNQFQLVYSQNVESTRRAIENLMQEFHRLKFVPV
jgi:ABC-type transporter Mla MlaB component